MSKDTKSWINCHIQSLIGGRAENQDSALIRQLERLSLCAMVWVH